MERVNAAIKGFPQFAWGVFVGLFVAVLTKIEVFLLLILGVLIGLATNAITGAAIAFGLYVVLYFIGQYVALASRQFALYLRLMAEDINDRKPTQPTDH
jgi:hypothetical protein